ncbi:MAG: VWA domain-containing protein [Treponema sp.]|nr:VWA domain-containing protein [Treponema sp.]
MSFEKPELLFLLFLEIPLILMFFIRLKKREHGADFIAAPAPQKEKETVKKRIISRVALSDVFFVIFSFFMIMGLAGPRWGSDIVPDTRSGLDLVLAFDISRSMNAADCPDQSGGADISRLQRALIIARDLCYRSDDIRFAAAAGKGKGILMVPLTWDSEAVLGFLDSLDDTFLTGSGTNLESLVNAAFGAFSDNMNRHRGIILFTDGESLDGELQTSLESAAASGIIVSTVGLGTNEGARIPVEKSPAAPGGFLLAPDNTEVISSRHEDALINAAENSGGIYADGSSPDCAASLAGFYRSMAGESSGAFRRESTARWQLFVIAGLVCFGLSRLLGFRKKNPAGGALFVSVLFTVLFSSCSFLEAKLLVIEGNYYYSGQRYNEAISSYLKASGFDESGPYAEYGLGLSYYALDENEAALRQYAAAQNIIGSTGSAHNELRYRLNFNTGVIQFEEDDFKGAAESFRRALEIDGSRLDAKRNLELSLLALSMQNKNESAAVQPAAGSQGANQGDTESESVSGANEVRQGVRTLYDYLRRREQDQWRNEWTGDSNPVWPDY